MRLVLSKRENSSRWMGLLSPLIAVALTIASGAVLFAAIAGQHPERQPAWRADGLRAG